MTNVHLFGDAKATAHAAESGTKQQGLLQAQAAYAADASKENQLKYAAALFDNGRFDESLKLYENALAKYGEDMQLYYDLAFTYKNLKKIDDAKRCFLKVVELNARHSLARSAEHELWMLDPSYKPSWMRK
jgi:tetratricopeptide (TPR) repeat protein